MRLLWLLLAVAGLLCVAEQCAGLRAESAALKRKRKKNKSSDQRLLLTPASASGPDYVQLATQRYLSNTELTERLQDFEQRCKPIARLHKIGSSVGGR